MPVMQPVDHVVPLDCSAMCLMFSYLDCSSFYTFNNPVFTFQTNSTCHLDINHMHFLCFGWKTGCTHLFQLKENSACFIFIIYLVLIYEHKDCVPPQLHIVRLWIPSTLPDQIRWQKSFRLKSWGFNNARYWKTSLKRGKQMTNTSKIWFFKATLLSM